jgi:drug/metabolite transporter (DMT)-like permease
VPPELAAITDSISLTPVQAIGIPIALFGAILISIGTQLQHTGVARVGSTTDTKAGLSIRQLLALVGQPLWVGGTLMLGLAILFQLTSLGFAPLIVVQPLGAIALVVTAIVNSRQSGVKLDRLSIRAIVLCVGGVGLFVTIAALTAKSSPITELQLRVVLIILAVVLVAFALAFALLRKRFTAIFYIVGAGVLFGFVATLAKVVIDRVKTLVNFTGLQLAPEDVLTVLCIVGLIVAALLGSYFVQSAYSNGPPDLVVAGLTVIDPLVAITIGIVVLGEASHAPVWAILAFIVAGAIAIFGVFMLAKTHPQSQH